MANYIFTTTSQKSSDSHVAQVMNNHNLDRAVYFILRGGTKAQRDEVYEHLEHVLVDLHPIVNHRHPRRHRIIVVCRTFTQQNDLQILDDFRSILRYVFGPTCRIQPRVVWRSYGDLENLNFGGEEESRRLNAAERQSVSQANDDEKGGLA